MFEDAVGTIALALPLIYSGAQPLSIDARGVVLDGSGLASGAGALVADGGADLEIRGLTVRNARGVGITVAGPGTQTGILTDFAGGGDLVADSRNVTTHDNGSADGDAGLKPREKGEGDLHGLLIDPASSNNAIGGILVREDAGGFLDATIVNATASENAGHGITFDENSAGNLTARIQRAWAASNGGAGVRAEQGLAGVGDLRIQALTAPGNTGGEVSTDANVTVVRIP